MKEPEAQFRESVPVKIEKSVGVTPTEELLSGLCERTFLKLWSWPNPHKRDGDELCDLITVFDNHVYIFFDRESRTLQDSNKDITLTWSRWKKKVIDRQIKTAKGAERYIKNSGTIFLDSKCKQPLPAEIPANPIIHKVIVAHGAEDACKSFSEENPRGSMGISYGMSEDFPSWTFLIHLESGDPVHVFDSSNLEIMLTELDTFSDFTSYITEKERVIQIYSGLMYCGEEDLLAHYFGNYDEQQNVYRIGNEAPDANEDPEAKILCIPEGKWMAFEEEGLRERRREANEESYLWDHMIQKTYQNSLDGTLGGTASGNLISGRDALYEMVKENRLSRRALSRSMLNAMCNFPPSSDGMIYQLAAKPSMSDNRKCTCSCR